MNLRSKFRSMNQGTTTHEQWHAAAAVLRDHAAKLDALALTDPLLWCDICEEPHRHCESYAPSE